MSIPALTIASEAGVWCGDPSFTRITRDDWLIGLNAVCRDISVRIPCVEWEATAATVANEDRIIYPDDLVQIRAMRYSEAPGTIDYRDLDEDKFDEWRNATSRQYQVGDPSFYLPGAKWANLRPKPATSIEQAVLMRYFGLAEAVTDLTTQFLALPDMLRDYVVEGMVIFGKKKNKEFEEARALEDSWRERATEWRDRAADRARDRRTSLRTRGRRFGGQV